MSGKITRREFIELVWITALLAACGKALPTIEQRATGIAPERTSLPTPRPTAAGEYEPTPVATTKAPTLAPTPMPTVELPKATLTATKVENLYPIDMAKSIMPDSEAALEANPDNFIEAPDPLTDIDAFNDWWFDNYIPALGDRQKLEPNLVVHINEFIHGDLSLERIVVDKRASPLLSKPNFFYFKHEDIFYPVLVVTGDYMNSGYIVTNAVILYDGGQMPDNEGLGVIEKLSQGKPIANIGIWEKTVPYIPDHANELIKAGLVGFVDEDVSTGTILTEHVPIGPGVVHTK